MKSNNFARNSQFTTHNYTMPAEWEKQESILLAWPHHKADWPGKFAPIPWVYCEIIRHIASYQKVRLLIQNAAAQKQAKDMLSQVHANLKNVEFFHIPTNRSWMRDTGPIVVRDSSGKKTILDFKSTGWAKYPNHRLDNQVREQLNKKLKLPLVKPRHKGRHVVLEGGGIDVNGKGTLITTEEWLLSDVQVRNPGFTRDDYEKIFAKYLGINQVIWLGSGIAGDDTHGHVDDITRFVSADTIVTVVEKNTRDPNHAPLKENLQRLKRLKKFNIVEVPMAKPLFFEDQRLPASYANFLITNHAVLVPTFNDSNDRIALNILAELFPKREVIGIHSVDLVWGFGTIHCLSQQEPK